MRRAGATSLCIYARNRHARKPTTPLAEGCFTYGRRTWHSVMITLMKPEITLYYVRKQVGLSHLAHAPRDFCFLFKGHALDPTVEDKMRAMKAAVYNEVRVGPAMTFS